jgi:polyvinyl alcohol dehydrogenase (cytochrome)
MRKLAGALGSAAVVAALGLPSAALGDWPVYGHDLANTRNAGSEGPAPADIGSLKQAWAFHSDTGDFTGTPAVAGGVLVAGDQGGVIYALDAVTGKKLWSHDAGAPINGSAAIDLDAPGGATAFVPVADEGKPRLVALFLRDGAKRWESVLTDQENSSVFGSPTFWEGRIYMGTSGPNNDDSHARGSVVALDEASGARVWQTFTVPPGSDGAAVWSTPAIDPATGRLYVGTGNNYHAPTTDTEDAMLALDARSGAIVGKYQATSNDSFAPDNATSGPDHDFGASPNLFSGPDGTPLVGEGQKSGVYSALDRRTMAPVWQRTVGPGGYLGGLLGSTAFDGERIFAADTLDGQVSALARDGQVAWQSAEGGGAHLAPLTVAHGVLYTVDPSGSLFARDPATGNVLGSFSLGGPSFGGVAAAGRALYVSVGIGPPPEPAPQNDGTGSIVAFGDTSRSGAPSGGGGGSGARGGGGRLRTMRLVVTPRRALAGRRTTLRFRVTSGGRAVTRARVRVGRRLVRTDRHGRAHVRLRFTRPGRRTVRASRGGFRRARTTIRVVRR